MRVTYSPEVAAQLEALKVAEAFSAYRTRLEELAAIRPCSAPWPGDPAGPGYVGTRCQLLEGHAQREGTPHRHRMLGTQTTVAWEDG